jgi:hypothetical protein
MNEVDFASVLPMKHARNSEMMIGVFKVARMRRAKLWQEVRFHTSVESILDGRRWRMNHSSRSLLHTRHRRKCTLHPQFEGKCKPFLVDGNIRNSAFHVFWDDVEDATVDSGESDRVS